jgi:hypothetical protein
VAVEPTPYNPDGFHKSATAKAESQDADDDKKLAAAKFLLAKNTIRWQWVDGPDGKRVGVSSSLFVLLDARQLALVLYKPSMRAHRDKPSGLIRMYSAYYLRFAKATHDSSGGRTAPSLYNSVPTYST